MTRGNVCDVSPCLWKKVARTASGLTQGCSPLEVMGSAISCTSADTCTSTWTALPDLKLSKSKFEVWQECSGVQVRRYSDRTKRATCIGYFVGHTSSVRSLDHHAHLSRLMSADLEGPAWIGTEEASFTILLPPGCDQRELGVDVPAGGAWIPTEAVQILSGFTSSRVAILDAQRCGPVTCVCCNFAVLSGHVDGKARLLDFTTGANLKEHSDAVTSVSIDPVRGFCVVRGCHDGFVRSFDLRTGRCRPVLGTLKSAETLKPCFVLTTRLACSPLLVPMVTRGCCRRKVSLQFDVNWLWISL